MSRFFFTRIFLVVSFFLATVAHGAPFTAGNIVVYRVGTGAAALTANATEAFLDEYTPAGALVQTIALPTADAGANQILTNSGSATTEGLMTRSSNGQFLVMAGYDAPVGTAAVAGTTSAAINRVFGRVGTNGVVDTSTVTTTAFSASNPRGAASVDGTGFWGSGGNTGVIYVPFGTNTTTVVSSTFTNLRSVNISGGASPQLYVSSQASTLRLGSVGTGTPTTAGQTTTSLPGFPTATVQTNQYAFVDLDPGVAGIDTAYVADDRATGSGGGAQKWTFDGVTWTQRGTLNTGLATGLRGLCAAITGVNTVTIYATDASAASRLVSATDTSGPAANINGTFTTLVTAGANTAFRSVAFAPVASVPTLSISDVTQAEGNAGTSTFNFTVSINGTSATPVTFDVATQDGTTNPANAGSDYVAAPATGPNGTIPAGTNTSTTVSITVNGDLTVEPNETFFVNISNVVGATPLDTQGLGTINNDDSPTLFINDVTQSEGNAGTSTFNFTVSIVGTSPTPVTFDVATQDGTTNPANAGSDYVAAPATGPNGTIPAGTNTSTTVSITVNGDVTVEANETFFVNISNVVGASVGDPQGLGTINNDDFTKIHDIQGNGTSSPLVATSVTTHGIVTGIKSNGFFIQEPDASIDADPATSEGIFVFTSGPPPGSVVMGNDVQVVGTVSEFVPSSDPQQPPLTELTSPTVSLLSSGNPLPAAIPLTPTFPDPSAPFDQLERIEGMRVTAASMTVIGPSDGSVNESAATGTSNGRFHAVVTGVARPFREPGIQPPDLPPTGTIPPIPRWDGNPERLRVESATINSQPILTVKSSDVVGPIAGPLDYGFRGYAIYPDGTLGTPVVTPGTLNTMVSTPLTTEFTVASFNMERFFDTVNDPESDAVLTATAFNNRLLKASIAIRNHLKFPDVVGVQEMEHLSTLQAVATQINNDAVANAQPNPMYVAYLTEGNDVGGIDVGYLVKTAPVPGGAPRVAVNSVTQVGAVTTYIDPTTGAPDTLNDRPPLVLDATINRGPGQSFNVIVINNHLRSLLGLTDETPSGPTTTGDRVRRKRQIQADFLAQYIQGRLTTTPGEHIIVIGDMNNFEFNDGYQDSLDTIAGTPVPDNQTAVCSICPQAPNTGDGIDQLNPDLTNLVNTPTATERYSYVFDGNAQNIDHALVSPGLITDTSARRIEHPRIDADYPESERNTNTTAFRVSDHDPIVAYFAIPQPGALEFSASNYNVSEATTTFNVTVNRTGGSDGAVSADYAITAGTATSGADFTAATGTVNFADGETSKTFPVTIVNDTTDEPDQTINLALSNPTGGATIGAQSTATITIQDDDAAPTISIDDINFAEGNAGGTQRYFNVTLSAASEFTVSVDFNNASGTATQGTDFNGPGGNVTFGPGVTSVSNFVYINVLGDLVYENNETAQMNLTNPVNATILDNQGVLTINNDDAQPTLSIDDQTVTEGNAGTQNVIFTVTLTGATEVPVSFDAVPSAGTAACCGSDWSGGTQGNTFTPGETTKPVNLTVFGDVVYETNETAFFDLQNVTNATILDGHGVLTINNDDNPPVFTISDNTQIEGNAGSTNGTLTVTLTGATQLPASVTYTTADGTASQPGDYTTTTNTLNFPVGTTTQPINIPVIGDTSDEANETVLVNLSGESNATIGDSQGVLTIIDDDGAPQLVINDNSGAEGNAGSSNGTLTVTLVGSTLQTVTVDYTTAPGSATTGTDYTTVTNTLTFNPGTTTLPIDIPILGDLVFETNETVLVNLSNPTNATIGDPQGIYTINNDDAAPVFTINDNSLAEGNAGSTNGTLTVTKTGATEVTATVDFATAPGTATAGTDYTTTGNTLTFLPGDTTLPINVPILGETINEANETVLVNLSNGTNASIGDTQGVLTINNDDAPPSILINDVTQAEGNAGTSNFNFNVTLSGNATQQTVTVQYATANNSATAGSDYNAASGTLTFNPGVTSQPVAVQVIGDATVEPNETFFVNLSNATIATIGDNQGLGTITDDDGALTADLSITQAITPPNPHSTDFITITLTVTNNGPGIATNVVVTDTVPPGLTIQSVTPSQGTCGAPTVTCQLGTILNGANATITIVLQPPGHSGAFGNNTAAVSSDQTEPTPANNSSSAAIVVTDAGDIPTLSEWALLALALALAAFAAMKLRT